MTPSCALSKVFGNGNFKQKTVTVGVDSAVSFHRVECQQVSSSVSARCLIWSVSFGSWKLNIFNIETQTFLFPESYGLEMDFLIINHQDSETKINANIFVRHILFFPCLWRMSKGQKKGTRKGFSEWHRAGYRWQSDLLMRVFASQSQSLWPISHPCVFTILCFQPREQTGSQRWGLGGLKGRRVD